MADPITGAEEAAAPIPATVSMAAAPAAVLATILPTAPAPYPTAPAFTVSMAISPAASPTDFLPLATSTILLPKLNPAPDMAPDLAAEIPTL